MIRMWGTALAVAGALVILGAAPAQALEKFSYGLSWLPEAEHCGFYEARETGLYRAAGLDVKIVPGGPGVAAPRIWPSVGYTHKAVAKGRTQPAWLRVRSLKALLALATVCLIDACTNTGARWPDFQPYLRPHESATFASVTFFKGAWDCNWTITEGNEQGMRVKTTLTVGAIDPATHTSLGTYRTFHGTYQWREFPADWHHTLAVQPLPGIIDGANVKMSRVELMLMPDGSMRASRYIFHGYKQWIDGVCTKNQ